MARDLSAVKTRFISGLRRIYNASNFGADASSLTVEELQRIVQQLLSGHNTAREAWDDFVDLEGATQARVLLAETINNPPADVGASLFLVRTNIIAILDAYESNFGAGTPNKTFSYAQINGLFTGGLTDVQVGAGVVTALNGLCSTLRTSVESVTPVN